MTILCHKLSGTCTLGQCSDLLLRPCVLCPRWFLRFFIVLLFVNLVFFEDYAFTAQAFEKKEGPGQTCLVSSPQAAANSQCWTTASNLSDFARPSFKRSWVVTPYFCSHVEIQGSLAVLELQQAQPLQNQLLRGLWRTLGRFYGSYLCPSKPAATEQSKAIIFDQNLAANVSSQCLFRLESEPVVEWADMGSTVRPELFKVLQAETSTQKTESTQETSSVKRREKDRFSTKVPREKERARLKTHLLGHRLPRQRPLLRRRHQLRRPRQSCRRLSR